MKTGSREFKGQKFIPAPNRVDTVAKFEDLKQFARKLRLKLYFSKRSGGASGNSPSDAYEQDRGP